MLWEGPGYAVKIDGRMDKDLYIKILDEDLASSLGYYGKTPSNIIFQQDNNLKHTCNKTTRGFGKARVMLFAKSSNSTNINTKILRDLTGKMASIKLGEDVLAGSRGESFCGDSGFVQLVVVVYFAHVQCAYTNTAM